MMAKSSFIAACVAFLSAQMVFGQEGVMVPPRGAWNGAEGAAMLQWGCEDGNSQVPASLCDAVLIDLADFNPQRCELAALAPC